MWAGCPEIIQNGINGVLTQNNPPAIGEAIRQALARREILAVNARRSVAAVSRAMRCGNQTMSVYQRVLGCQN